MVLVVHVANFGTRPKGAFQNNVERKLTNGLIRNGHQVIAFSDRESAMAGSPFGATRAGGVGYANRALAELCLAVEPEVLILGQTDVIRPQAVAELRRRLPAMRVAQWSVDALFEPGNTERLTRNLPVVDATLVTTAGDALAPLARTGKRLGFLPNPVDHLDRARREPPARASCRSTSSTPAAIRPTCAMWAAARGTWTTSPARSCRRCRR